MKRILVFTLLLPLAFSGCIHGYKAHPGSINTFDSVSYDAILDYKAALDEAKTEYAKGQLPPASKEYINQAVAAYNTADSSWQLYHSGHTENIQQLQADINAFAQSIAALRAAFGGK